jgi:hypothetical protein
MRAGSDIRILPLPQRRTSPSCNFCNQKRATSFNPNPATSSDPLCALSSKSSHREAPRGGINDGPQAPVYANTAIDGDPPSDNDNARDDR